MDGPGRPPVGVAGAAEGDLESVGVAGAAEGDSASIGVAAEQLCKLKVTWLLLEQSKLI